MRARGEIAPRTRSGGFKEAAADPRVWALFAIYACCFGMELTIDNVAALYFADYFHLALTAAGFVAASFGMMNLFARALGGIVSDRCNRRLGPARAGRAAGLHAVRAKGLALILFSRMRLLPLAIGSMMLTGLFVKMSNGATYSVVPFVNKRALGAVAGIVGRGGQRRRGAGRVPLQKRQPDAGLQALLILGGLVTVSSSLVVVVQFSEADEHSAREEAGALPAGEMAAAAVGVGD